MTDVNTVAEQSVRLSVKRESQKYWHIKRQREMILKKQLHLRQISVRWIPHPPTEEQKK